MKSDFKKEGYYSLSLDSRLSEDEIQKTSYEN